MRIKIFVLGMIVFLTAAQIGFAHPPREMVLGFDADKGLLKVDLTHVSRDHVRHHIRKISISNNGEEVKKQFYRQQVKPSGFNAEFNIEAEPGDVISVKANCSEGGSKEESIDIAEGMTIEEEEPKEPEDQIPTILYRQEVEPNMKGSPSDNPRYP